ncbi:MAG: N-acetylmuramic acid 6-phosphate etherase [Chitinophagales bacterium]
MARLTLDGLVTESRNPRTLDLDLMSLEDALATMNDEDATVAAAVRRELPAVAEAVRRMTAAFEHGGRVFYVGAGTSGRLGLLDAAECPPTFGTDPAQFQALMAGGAEAAGRAKEGAEDDEEAGRRDLAERGLTARDVVVGLAASGRTPYVAEALRYAREVGATTVAVVCNPSGEVAALADVAIQPVVGPEVVMGSTRLKAGTAQKLVLNMLSTMTMVQMGKVYSNLMVDMQATNAKLRSRAVRMLRLATGLPEEEAEAALAEAGGNLKVAIVKQLAGVSAAEAAARLEQAGGRVRAALSAGGAGRPVAASDGHQYYLGVDGGQTSTRSLIIREDGTIHGAGQGPGVPHLLAPGGRGQLAAVLREVVDQAQGRQPAPLRAAFLGLSGVVAGGALEAAARQAAGEVLPGVDLCVENDGVVAWAGALGLRLGLIAIAGTGSLVLGRDAAGRTERAGGWGYLFGDEPGAFGLALAAIKTAQRDWDAGRRGTALEEAITSRFGVALPQVAKAFYAGELTRDAIAALTPEVAGLAQAGDPRLAGLFREAALVLAEQLIQVARRLAWPGDRIPWSPIGGVFRSGALFTGPLQDRLSAEPGPKFVMVPPELPPVAGAALLARFGPGKAPEPAVVDRLKHALSGGEDHSEP